VDGIPRGSGVGPPTGVLHYCLNHAPVLNPGYEDTLAMMQENRPEEREVIASTCPFFRRQRTDYVREAVEKCGKDLLYTHYGAGTLVNHRKAM